MASGRAALCTSLAAWAQAPVQPALVAQSSLNAADTAWMMTSTALVLLMALPGIALFYGGMVRKKSVINTLASNAEYATEIVRFARAKATGDGHADLAEWASKLESAMAETHPMRAGLTRRSSPVAEPLAAPRASAPSPDLSPDEASPHRYIRGIR